MRVFIEPSSVRSSGDAIRNAQAMSHDVANWARSTGLPELPPHLQTMAESTLRGTVGVPMERSATVLQRAASELHTRAANAESVSSGGSGRGPKGLLSRVLGAAGGLFGGHGNHSLLDTVGKLASGLKNVAGEARGRPRSMWKALTKGNLSDRIAHVERTLQQRAIQSAHKSWNGAWEKAGLKKFQPKWGDIKGPFKSVGRKLSIIAPAAETMSQLRQGHYSQAASTVGAAIVTKPAALIDVATGGSVTGFAKTTFELPGMIFGGDDARNDFTERVHDGDYGVLPQWEAKYVSDPLAGFIFDHFYKH
jgi:hypothetical protein